MDDEGGSWNDKGQAPPSRAGLLAGVVLGVPVVTGHSLKVLA